MTPESRHTGEGRAMDVQTPTRIVILGKTGSGKSSLGNTILQDQVFPISHSSNSESKTHCTETRSVNGKLITLIETPGFFDKSGVEESFKHALDRYITECAPEPHVFLITLKVERYTVHEQEVIHKIHQYFSDEAFKYAVVVFTHGDQLPEGQMIEEFVAQNEALNGLVQKCGGRCHVVDNKHWKNSAADDYRSNTLQVARLLHTIDNVIKGNNSGYYTNDMFQDVIKALEKEEDDIRKTESSEISQAELRKSARSNVYKQWVITLAGTATGVFLGAIPRVFNMVKTTLLTTQSLVGLSIDMLALTALGGVFSGGVKGYVACREATSPQKAVGRVWDAFMNQESREQAKTNVLPKYIDNLSTDDPQKYTEDLSKSHNYIIGLFKLLVAVIMPKLNKFFKNPVPPSTGDEVLSPSDIEVVQKAVSPIKKTLEDQVFPISHSSHSESCTHCTETRSVNGKLITLIEMPGFFDTCDSEDLFKHTLVKCITECAPGPHVFLITLKVERYTVHEQEIIDKFNQYFSDEAFKYAVVVFTHGDQLPEGQMIEEFVAQNEALNGLVQKCGGRCHVVDNKHWKNAAANDYRSNTLQVARLLHTIDNVLKGNNSGYYTNEMFQDVIKALEKEKDDIINSVSISQAERSNDDNGWVTILAGTTTGALLGALLEVVEMVTSTLLNTQSLSGLSRGAIILTALDGFFSGGIKGYEASIEATSPQEAVGRVWGAFMNHIKTNVFQKYTDGLLTIVFQKCIDNLPKLFAYGLR